MLITFIGGGNMASALISGLANPPRSDLRIRVVDPDDAARARLLAGSVAVVFFLQLWVNGSTWSWWGDSAFSARRMLGLAAIWMLGAAFAVDRVRQLHARWPRSAHGRRVDVLVAE